jgi:predicted dehydrogenase
MAAMTSLSSVSRRQFFLASTAALAVPYIIPRSVRGANERIVTGHVGVGGQGGANLKSFLKLADLAEPAALCDVDKLHLAATLKSLETGKGPKQCEGYGDYRRLLDRKDIDAVVVSTPDHWHTLVSIHACQAGKDVYCEKPLTLTIAEGRKMVDVARKQNRIVQTGSQQRSEYNGMYRLACELVRSGKIGKMQRALVGIPSVNFKGPAVADSTPPPELDYDQWIGPAPMKPYNEKHVHYNFRFFWDYSGGQMTNFGAHDLDIVQWALNMDNSGPIAVEGTAKFDDDHTYEVTKTCRLTYTYENGVQVMLGQQQKDIPAGATFIGSEGRIHVTRKAIISEPKEIATTKLGPQDVHLYPSGSHHKNFLDCMKSRELPICDVEIGHRSATVCHLGNIAVRLGRKIKWDPSAEQIVGDAEAAKWVDRPKRAPYTI